MDWLFKMFSWLFLLIDKVIYGAVDVAYRLFIMISETGVFTPENIRTFGSRIYVLLGVFMLFKVSFSFINYILNPDSFSDKSQGAGKLVMNALIVLIGIVTIPYIFQAAYSLQSIILKENVIGSLVMGMNAEVMNTSNYNYVEQGGDLMAYTTLSAFIRLNPEVVGEECANNPVIPVYDEDGLPVYEEKMRKAELNPACTADETAAAAMEVDVNNNSPLGTVLVNAYQENNVDYFLGTNIVNLTVEKDGDEEFIFEYSFIISSIAGGFLAWILLIFCIDVATRSVKLGFLQLIAPIPIISYIDPKSGKDGIFKKWMKQCTSTYLSLFVRLLAIYFVLFIITLVINGGIINVTTGKEQTNIFVIILIIFGALMFAKELPKLISDITGIKLDGGFTLNPLKKLGSSPYAAGAMGLVGGAIGGGIANAWAARKNGLSFGKGLLSTAGGVFGGGRRGLMAGATSGGKGSLFDGAVKGITDSSARRNLRKFGQVDKNGNPVDGYSTWDMAMDKVTTMAGVKYSGGTSSHLKSEVNKLQERLNNAKMNEQNNSSALQHRISEQGNKMAALLATFNGDYKEDEKGNLEKYVTKTYDDYLEQAGRQYVKEQGFEWDNITQVDRDAVLASLSGSNYVVDEATFGSLNSLYEARNAADIEGRGLQKQIKDMQEDIDSFKGKKSS